MQIDTNRFSWFDVSDDVKELLVLATQTWDNTEASENYIQQALVKTEENTCVLVAAYRYFYYKNNYVLALTTAEKITAKIKKEENLPDNWQALLPILVQHHQEPQIRLFLNAYAASALILAKLGKIEEAKEISARIKGIDDKNDFGGGILLDILTRPREEDD